MGAMISGDLLNVGQGGMTIGIGLLLDTLIVRSLMTPSIAAILGPWFWWPLKVRSRPSYSERMRSVHQQGESTPLPSRLLPGKRGRALSPTARSVGTRLTLVRALRNRQCLFPRREVSSVRPRRQ